MVTRQLQVECRTAKERWPEIDVLPLSKAANHGEKTSERNHKSELSFRKGYRSKQGQCHNNNKQCRHVFTDMSVAGGLYCTAHWLGSGGHLHAASQSLAVNHWRIPTISRPVINHLITSSQHGLFTVARLSIYDPRLSVIWFIRCAHRTTAVIYFTVKKLYYRSLWCQCLEVHLEASNLTPQPSESINHCLQKSSDRHFKRG